MAFIISIMSGIIKVIALLTNRLVFIRFLLAVQTVFFVLFGAECTDDRKSGQDFHGYKIQPVDSFCKTLNFGMATVNRTKITVMIATTPMAMVHVMSTLVFSTL